MVSVVSKETQAALARRPCRRRTSELEHLEHILSHPLSSLITTARACHPRQPSPEQLQPCRLPVPSHPSCPCAAVRAGGLPAASCAGQPLARGVRADPRRGQQRAGWQQGGMGWADAVGGKGRLIFLSPQRYRTMFPGFYSIFTALLQRLYDSVLYPWYPPHSLSERPL